MNYKYNQHKFKKKMYSTAEKVAIIVFYKQSICRSNGGVTPCRWTNTPWLLVIRIQKRNFVIQ